jgi:hypothetical protein
MTWRESLPFLIRFNIALFNVLLIFSVSAKGQYFSPIDLDSYSYNYTLVADSSVQEFPDPSIVVRRSLIIPGWGQVTNKQVWKVPIVYGLIGGLSYYSVYLTKQYHDYRAAYYNSFDSNTDMRFGATPGYLAGQNPGLLKSNRDFLRNRRDFIYVTVFLSYVLNAVDAYVFAHLRPFDVSDDLSMNRTFKPSSISSKTLGEIPSLALTISF